MYQHTDRFGRVHTCETARFVVTGEYSGSTQSFWSKTRAQAEKRASRMRRENQLIGVEVHEAVRS